MSLEDLNEREFWHVQDSFSTRRYSRLAKSRKGSCSRILDVGVGSGIGGIILKTVHPGALIYGVDIVKSRTISVPDVYKDVHYESATNTSFEDSFFDLIVAGEIIEHIAVDQVDAFFHEMFRILSIGGTFSLTTPNPNDLKLRIRSGTNLGGSHLSQHFIRETCSRLRMSGFRIRRVIGTGKTSIYIGNHFPKIFYGSYLVTAEKY
jgi:2-polyprenyl-3-methyl-5-hydroxy-6-metoxy-1,4-benzoquinol methylase